MSLGLIGLDGAELAVPARHVIPIDRAGLAGEAAPPRGAVLIGRAEGDDLAAYHRLRRDAFVVEQGLFDRSDLDDLDRHPDTIALVAKEASGAVVGGVRLAARPAVPGGGWWSGSRLVVRRDRRRHSDIGATLVRAAAATAEGAGALRFDAAVQLQARAFFERLGWEAGGSLQVAGTEHVEMQWPIDRIGRLVRATKAPLAAVLGDLAPGGVGWVGDDAAPVPGSDLVAACDAILASMVERDPDWAGWCSVLVNLNDLAAMGAQPVALLDAVAAPTPAAASRVIAGLRRAADAYGVPVIGGHTQVGAPAALSVTAIGRCRHPVPGGGGRVGDEVRLSVDVAGSWRTGYGTSQWDSTSGRRPDELRSLLATVSRLDPHAAKDVSMAGIVGTLGMLAEASGCGAELDVAAIPRPPAANLGDWLTCFPGFAMLSTDTPGRVPDPAALVRPAVSAVCGRLVAGAGVTLVWPDGRRTTAIPGSVTGLGRAAQAPAPWR